MGCGAPEVAAWDPMTGLLVDEHAHGISLTCLEPCGSLPAAIREQSRRRPWARRAA